MNKRRRNKINDMLKEKEVEYMQNNQTVWQIRRSYQRGWNDFANELTPEETVLSYQP